jgi:PilZ domain
MQRSTHIPNASASPSMVLPLKKAGARTALVNLSDASRTLLVDCFRQFGIEAVPVTINAAERLSREKFEACVLPMAPESAPVMEAARASASNSRMIIYALGGTAKDALRYSKFGVNAMFHEPLERPAALKLVRATQMLVQHEFRRYVRIPVMTEVSVMTNGGGTFTATSAEISTGGMSVSTAQELAKGSSVEISFALLTLPRVLVRGTVTWRRGRLTGIRFDQDDDRRRRIKDWITSYLEN